VTLLEAFTAHSSLQPCAKGFSSTKLRFLPTFCRRTSSSCYAKQH